MIKIENSNVKARNLAAFLRNLIGCLRWKGSHLFVEWVRWMMSHQIPEIQIHLVFSFHINTLSSHIDANYSIHNPKSKRICGDMTKLVVHRPFLGGPSSLLPRPVESFLSWSLCISCLSVSGYHYCVAAFIKPLLTKLRFRPGLFLRRGISSGADGSGPNVQKLPFFQCWIPLTTHSRSEVDRGTPFDRYQQLIQILIKYGFTAEKLASIHNGMEMCASNGFSTTCSSEKLNDDEHDLDSLVALLRENTICRHLASLVMRPHGDSMNSWNQERFKLPLVNILVYVWPRLLELPNRNVHKDVATCFNESDKEYKYKYEISMVIPAYGEKPEMMKKQLTRSLASCKSPRAVEIIIVDAGGNNLDMQRKDEIKIDGERGETRSWGDVKVLTYTKGGGRGPCLNYGAAAANGRIVTFCHLDTALPNNWDCGISTTIDSRENGFRANSCAFGFGIDTSAEGLSNGFTANSNMYFPPGIRAVETTANIRTQLYSLPYGDQAISVAKDVFDFVGGFPDQCLMEDYELVSLLRKRSALIPKLCDLCEKEELKIIPGKAALCSPRRWQKFGVLYVTFMNSKFVNLYCGGITPDQLYELYYGRDPPARESELSPWEVRMSEVVDLSEEINL